MLWMTSCTNALLFENTLVDADKPCEQFFPEDRHVYTLDNWMDATTCMKCVYEDTVPEDGKDWADYNQCTRCIWLS